MDSSLRKFGCATLGCRLNQYESDALIGQFLEQGFTLAETVENGEGDISVYIINTCAVTARGEQKSRQAVARARREHPEALIIVTGCAAEENQAQFPRGARVIFVDTNHKHAIAQIALQALAAREPSPDAFASDRFSYAPARASRHTRAGLKAQDGCDNQCAYCVVPRVRGRAQSRPLADCLRAARELLALGYREIVLTGVNLQQYRDAQTGQELDALVSRLLEPEGDYRLRLSSLEPDAEPDGVTARVTRLFGHKRLCSNLHLCLQSGSDRILAAMGRHYRAGDCLELCAALRGRERFFNITADIIVGFPGESDQDFADTLALVRQAALTHVHAFPFSARPGCPAAGLPLKPSKTEARARMRELRRVVEQNRAAFLQSLIGEKERVLIEKLHPDGSASGYGALYIPITLSGGRFAKNTFADCEITGLAAPSGTSAASAGLAGKPL